MLRLGARLLAASRPHRKMSFTGVLRTAVAAQMHRDASRRRPAWVHKFAFHLPVEVDAAEFGMSRDELYQRLKAYNVFTRRYFYPLLCDFACYKSVSLTDPLTTARRAADRILTLPIYSELALDDAERICDIIKALCRQ